MREIRVRVNGQSLLVPEGTLVSAAIVRAGHSSTRRSVTGEPRGPLCGMGICFECRATVNGVMHVRGCQCVCQAEMEIATDE